MTLRIRSLTVLLGASAALCGGALATAREPIARAARTCGIGQGKGYGYTYLTTLTVYGVGCSTGKYVVKHHRSWSCTRKRLNTSPTQYQERETCTMGFRTVRWTYSQNTY